jgi:23S rRNA (uracil1939-C5)-methyltransferase
VTARDDAPAVGFKSASSHRVVPVPACPILDRRLQPLLILLPQWLSQLKQWRRIDELTLAVDADDRIAIDWSAKSSLLTSDRETFSSLCRAANISFGDAAPLRYGVPSQATSFTFSAGDFTQVNPAINDRMVERALTWLAPTHESRVIDLFCGLGNFTLPLGKIARSVTGIEGSAGMVERARINAQESGAADIHFECADLFVPRADLLQGFDSALLDPPRAGARAVCELLANSRWIERVVYISCNPQTLARDIAVLAGGGFTVERAALVDMFPQTGHSEAMVCLRRSDIQGR